MSFDRTSSKRNLQESGSASSGWLGIWEGNEEEEKDGGNIKRNERGQIGDWSSFMIAMDDEGGKELQRSMSTMKFDLPKQPPQQDILVVNRQRTSQPTLKTSSGMPPPPTTTTTTTTTTTPLKFSGSIPKDSNSKQQSPPTCNLSTTPTSPSQLNNFFFKQKQTTSISNSNSKDSNSKLQYQRQVTGSNLAASIHYNNNNSSSSSSPQPITTFVDSPRGSDDSSTTPLSSSPINLSGGIPFNKFSSSSPPLSTPPQSSSVGSGGGGDSGFLNFFRKKKVQLDGKTKYGSIDSATNSNMLGSSGGDDSNTPREVESTFDDRSTVYSGIGGASDTYSEYTVDDNMSTFSGVTISPMQDLGFSVSSDKIMEGWMERASSRSSWKKHWFVLRGIHLEYYKGWWEDKSSLPQDKFSNAKEKESSEKGKITLNYWYTFSKVTCEDSKFVFSIVQSSEVEKADKKNKLKFRCENEDIARKWVQECESVIKKRKETTVTLRPLIAADHRQAGGRRGTLLGNTPPFIPPLNTANLGDHSAQGAVTPRGGNISPNSIVPPPSGYTFEDEHRPTNIGGFITSSDQLVIPKELTEDLEQDEKKVLETVISLLDEFKPQPLPEGVSISDYRNKPRSPDGKYRILSLDGGGLRSVMVCVLIERIVKKFPRFLDYVDVFTGTSAGSIVAAGLAMQYPPKGTRRVLELTALPVFGKKRVGLNMGNAKYVNRLLRAACYVFFQKHSEYPPKAKQTAPEVRRWMPQLFHNILPNSTDPINNKQQSKMQQKQHLQSNLPIQDDWRTQEIVGDALLRSGSAPTFFPSYQNFIDGGVFCNNPAIAAISLASNPYRDNIGMDKMICLSLGTGISPQVMEGADGEEFDYGILQWASRLGNLFMGSQVDFLTQLCENMLAERYFRLNPLLGEHTSMDDPKLVSELATLANQVDLTETFAWIEKHWFPVAPLSPTATAAATAAAATNTTTPPLTSADELNLFAQLTSNFDIHHWTLFCIFMSTLHYLNSFCRCSPY
ncbi:pleckstrin domain-containing protein [Cavenderia fasciculata]|uniref:Pleckstrin domain-containing protein n=1 Tax=Cavenderia fasciculata TaxID=261658 RepID=F4PJH9_CACFS|nr:pleckstrin domain-containing protein [Cavenderia fasciculata]EGG24465.1 pleckstrin domain-containing protein [Cavenderia fasciculata]|eukprot:XP_004362316.1 pleckstrin domain-containing protein [Cavenderia fasciculata]